MNNFLLNVLLATVWMLINGNFGMTHFIIGFVIGYFCLWLTQPFKHDSGYFRRFIGVIQLIALFLYELIMSVGAVLWEVITPGNQSDPDIIHVPLDVRSDFEISILAMLVSLTPGSLCLDVSQDRKYLIIHAMFGSNHDEVIFAIKNRLEKKLLKVTRG